MSEFWINLSPTSFHWMVLSSLLFSIGIYGLLTRRNAIGILMSVELMLNAASLNFIMFNRLGSPHSVDGQIMSLFIIAAAAAEVVVGMAIFVVLYKHRRTMDVTHMNHIQDADSGPKLTFSSLLRIVS